MMDVTTLEILAHEMPAAALREAITEEALSFRRTPYRDHAALKGVGVDCASLAMLVMQAVGLVPRDYKLPAYFPQQWLNRHKEDTTYLGEVLKFADEITEGEAEQGDVVLFRLVRSYTHGAIILNWPRRLIHAVKGLGVIEADATRDRYMDRIPRRFFSFVRKAKR